MNIDNTIDALEQRMQGTAGTQLYRIAIEDQYMEQLKVRRKKTGVTHHVLWCLSLGDLNGQAQRISFYGYRIVDVIKKAQQWAGVPPRTRAKRKNGHAGADEQQPQAQV